MNTKNDFRLVLILGWMVFATAGFAQSSAKQINEAIKNIKSNLNKNPAQSKADLLQLIAKNPSAPDTCKANIYTDVAIAFGMLNQLDSGLWAINQALTYVTDKDFKRIYALRTKAILHRFKGEYAKATETITACLKLNDSIWKNQSFKAITLQEYATLCIDQNYFYQATRLYLQALDVVNSPNNKDENTFYNALKIQINLGEAYGRSGNYGFAIGTLQKTLPKLDSLKDYEGYIRAGYQLAEFFIQTNQCASADSLVNILLARARNKERGAGVVPDSEIGAFPITAVKISGISSLLSAVIRANGKKSIFFYTGSRHSLSHRLKKYQWLPRSAAGYEKRSDTIRFEICQK